MNAHRKRLLRKFTKGLLGFFIVISIAGGLCYLVEVIQWQGRAQNAKDDVRKVILTGALGGYLAWFIRYLSSVWEQRADWRRHRRDIHARLVKAFNTAKLCRRLLRARARRGPNDEKAMLDRAAWDGLMSELTMAQLEFEAVRREIKEHKAFEEDKKQIVSALETIEDYLSEITSEYEKETQRRSATEPLPSLILLADLPATAGFMEKYRKSSLFDLGLRQPMENLEGRLLDVPDLTR